MKTFLSEKLQLGADGLLTTQDIMIMVIAAILAIAILVLLICLIVFLVKKLVVRMNPRKQTIFKHRKTRYKDRTGKKHNF